VDRKVHAGSFGSIDTLDLGGDLAEPGVVRPLTKPVAPVAHRLLVEADGAMADFEGGLSELAEFGYFDWIEGPSELAVEGLIHQTEEFFVESPFSFSDAVGEVHRVKLRVES
jgi:hypothetical protein